MTIGKFPKTILCLTRRRRAVRAQPIETVSAPVIGWGDYIFEYATRFFDQTGKQLARRGSLGFFGYHQKLYSVRAQESEEAFPVFGNSDRKRVIVMLSRDAGDDPHFGAVAENFDGRIGSIFL